LCQPKIGQLVFGFKALANFLEKRYSLTARNLLAEDGFAFQGFRASEAASPRRCCSATEEHPEFSGWSPDFRNIESLRRWPKAIEAW
jgi:hypothetical protein